MSVVEFTDEQVPQLAYERFHHPHARVRRKIEVVWLKPKGFALRDICDVAGCCPNTFRSCVRDFEAGGVEGLQRWESGGTVSQLDQHADAICEYFTEHPPHTIAKSVPTTVDHLETAHRAELLRLLTPNYKTSPRLSSQPCEVYFRREGYANALHPSR